MSKAQMATDKALATIVVDRLLVPANKVWDRMGVLCYYMDPRNPQQPQSGKSFFDQDALALFTEIEIPGDFDAAAAKAFPELAAQLVQLKLSIEDAQKLEAERQAEPWERYDVEVGRFPDSRSEAKTIETDDVLNRFFKFRSQTWVVHPDYR